MLVMIYLHMYHYHYQCACLFSYKQLPTEKCNFIKKK